MRLAHGVGRVYELPIPLYLYIAGAAGTVLISFALRALAPSVPKLGAPRRLAGRSFARPATALLRSAAVAGLGLALVSGVVVRGEGFSLAALLFWVGFVVGTTAVNAGIEGAWEASDPWAALEDVYRIEGDGGEEDGRAPPWWLGPLLLYALFWFELVSGVGFDDFFVVMVLLAYSLYALSFRGAFGASWAEADPFSILFGFAGRIAPLSLRPDGLWARSPLAGLDRPDPMSRALFASLFVVLGSTTLDNVRETVGWTDLMAALGLDELPVRLVDSVALIGFAVVFLVPFLLSVRAAHAWVGRGVTYGVLARRFGWSLVPIGIAYVLAHNFPLLVTGIPALIRALSDPFEQGWNLAGTANLFSGYIPSPRMVWFAEIALIVGGHILGVLAAHRTALRLGETRTRVVRSQYALMVLMTIYTVATLWLLAQPLVA